jgi:hypothetical protein
VQLGQRLHAGVAAAHEDERQPSTASHRVGLGVCRLQLAQHMVAEIQRILDRLGSNRVLDEARDGERARHRADGNHQVLVAERERLSPSGRH